VFIRIHKYEQAVSFLLPNLQLRDKACNEKA
jgi:hypothetical protein